MTIQAPHQYGPVRPPGASQEAGGYVYTCVCKWVRWWPRQADAAAGRLVHQKKCPKRSDK